MHLSPDLFLDGLVFSTDTILALFVLPYPVRRTPTHIAAMADTKVYRATTTAPVNIAVVKYVEPHRFVTFFLFLFFCFSFASYFAFHSTLALSSPFLRRCFLNSCPVP